VKKTRRVTVDDDSVDNIDTVLDKFPYGEGLSLRQLSSFSFERDRKEQWSYFLNYKVFPLYKRLPECSVGVHLSPLIATNLLYDHSRRSCRNQYLPAKNNRLIKDPHIFRKRYLLLSNKCRLPRGYPGDQAIRGKFDS